MTTNYRKLWATLLGMTALTAGLIVATPVPFDPQRGLVEVQVRLDGRVNGKFGLDTGADRLYIDKTFAKANGFTFADATAAHEIVGLNGTDKSAAVSLRSLAIGDETLYNLAATAVDLDQLTLDRTNDHPDGLIGFDILRLFYLTIDYPAKTADLYMAEPRFLSGREFETVPFRQFRHLIIVDATINNRLTKPMILDYCASYTTVSRQLAAELELTPNANGLVTLSSVSLGDAVVENQVPAVAQDIDQYRQTFPGADFEGIIGTSFLWRHKITVDYKRRHIYIHTAR
jgi:hypothetical protein